MLETSRLIEAVDRLHGTVEALAESNSRLVDKFDGDRKFRRRVTSGLVVLSILAVALSSWAVHTVVSEGHSRCLRSNNLRTDIYSGVDAVLDRIEANLLDAGPEVSTVIDDAKVALRAELPLREC